MERHDLLPDSLSLSLSSHSLSLSLSLSGYLSFSPLLSLSSPSLSLVTSLPHSSPSPPLSSLSLSLALLFALNLQKSQLVVPAEQLQGRETQMEMFVGKQHVYN